MLFRMSKDNGAATDDVSEPGPCLHFQLEPVSEKDELIPDAAEVPRLAFAIRLRDTFRPGEQLQSLFLEWLRNIPAIAGRANHVSPQVARLNVSRSG